MSAAIAEEALGTILVEAVESVAGEGAASSVDEVLSAEGRFAIDQALGSAEAQAVAAAEETAVASGTVDVSTPEAEGLSWFGRTKESIGQFTSVVTAGTAAVASATAAITGSALTIRGGIETVKGVVGDFVPDVSGDVAGKVDVGIQRAIAIETKFAIGIGAVVVAWALFNR